MFPCPIHCEHVYEKEWRNQRCAVPGSTFTVSARKGGGRWRRKEGKRNWWRNNWRTQWMWRGLKDTHTPAPLQIKKKTWESRNLREVDTGLLHWGSRNEGELRILGKLMVGGGMERPTWVASVFLAPGRRGCPWLSRVEGAVEPRASRWGGLRVHRGWSTCLQLCGGTPRLLWCRYPEATQTCVAP